MKLQVMIKHPYNNHRLDFRKPQCLSVPNTFIVLLSHFPFGCVGVLIHVFIQRSCRRLMVLFSWSKGSGRSFCLSVCLSIYRSIYIYICVCIYWFILPVYIMYIYIYTYTAISNPSICIMYIYILCIWFTSPLSWFLSSSQASGLVWRGPAEKKGTAAAIFLGSWNPRFWCVSHENGWPSGGYPLVN